MKLDNTKAQMRKGILEYCVLLLLSKRPLYASELIQELKNAKLIIVEGTLYPLLTRLKNAGLLEYQWQESQQGPPRKYYTLTEDGSQFLAGLEESWTELSSTVNNIKNL
ncbi:PadR family transcriptional regulator [Halosquirtibacter xylanolyticus]|uniref:PadR family transcriptional regulator n=1 Tax=Halosquirtibacter xylanolyticus TaxID=3374599 RepID=UPI0037497850|nr:PadR family transcriptional regulator [Prolixibacteraceae bacterium]